MKRTLVLLVAILTACKTTQSRQPSNEALAQIEESKNLSQLVRSNSPHYWSWVKNIQAHHPQLQPFLQFEGSILGDAHMGNFGPYLVESGVTNTKSMEFVAIDFDDAGRGSFFLDFIRYVIASEAIDKKSVKKTALLESYMNGLQNPHKDLRAQLPKEAQTLMNMPEAEVVSEQIKYAEKKSEGHRFKLKKNELIAYNGPLVDAIKNKFKDLKILDIAQKIVERGGSKEALRLWLLVEKNNSKIIMELKEWRASGVNMYSPQQPALQVMPDVYSVFWPRLKPNAYYLETFNDQLFWVRERHGVSLDVPSEASSNEDSRFLSEYSTVCAMALGQAHGRQLQGVQLLTELKKKTPDELKAIIEPVTEAYLQILSQELRR